MLNKQGIAELRERLTAICAAGTSFFDKTQERLDQDIEYGDIWGDYSPPSSGTKARICVLPSNGLA